MFLKEIVDGFINGQLDRETQRQMLQQAVYFTCTACVCRNMFKPEVQVQVSRVRQDVVVIYVKQLMNMLGRIQQEQLIMDEQSVRHNAGDLRPDDLITNNDQIIANSDKNVEHEDG